MKMFPYNNCSLQVAPLCSHLAALWRYVNFVLLFLLVLARLLAAREVPRSNRAANKMAGAV